MQFSCGMCHLRGVHRAAVLLNALPSSASPSPPPPLPPCPRSYGLRYQYGMFRQVIQDGFQHEQPDYWLNFGNPWEIERVYVTYPVRVRGGERVGGREIWC